MLFYLEMLGQKQGMDFPAEALKGPDRANIIISVFWLLER